MSKSLTSYLHYCTHFQCPHGVRVWSLLFIFSNDDRHFVKIFSGLSSLITHHRQVEVVNFCKKNLYQRKYPPFNQSFYVCLQIALLRKLYLFGPPSNSERGLFLVESSVAAAGFFSSFACSSALTLASSASSFFIICRKVLITKNGYRTEILWRTDWQTIYHVEHGWLSKRDKKSVWWCEAKGGSKRTTDGSIPSN